MAAKVYLSASLPPFTRWSTWLWVPALFFGDVLLLVLIYGLIAILQRSRHGQYRAVQVALLVTQLFLALLVILLNSSMITYYRATSAILDWQVAVDFAKDYSSVSQLAARNSAPLYLLLLVHLVLAVVLWNLVQRTAGPPRKEYLLMSTSQPSITPRFLLRRVLFAAGIVVGVYFFCAYRSMPTTGNWRILSRPVLVVFGHVMFRNFIHDFNRPMPIGVADFEKIKPCETIVDAFHAVLHNSPRCPPPLRHDFSFARRDPQSKGIKNVVIVFLESARKDLFPLDKNSPWLKEILTEKVLHENPLTPFFSRLVQQGLFFEDARTVSSFTLKSMLGTLCSVIPMHTNHLTEWNRDAYRKCLPQLLQDHGWSTFHLQAGSSEWDHQRNHLFKMGFQEAIGIEEIERGLMGYPVLNSISSNLNYFGGDEASLIYPMIEWMINKREQGKPFLLSTITNVNHDPYYWPRDWPAYKFANDRVDVKVQRYLNTVRYTDAYLARLLQGMNSKQLLNDTLVVVMGDHGMALGEHQRVGTNENPAECLTRVPLLFYSENLEWRSKFPPRRIKGLASNLDVLPTILDMINEDKTCAEKVFTHYYEGSSLVRGPSRNPIQVSLINPGAHAIVLVEGSRKAVFKESENTVMYNLEKDPVEDFPRLENELSSSRDLAWYKKAVGLHSILLKKLDELWQGNIDDPNVNI